LNLLAFNHATSDPAAAVARGVSHLIVAVSVDDQRAAVGVKEGSRPRQQQDTIGGGVQMASGPMIGRARGFGASRKVKIYA